MRDSSRGPAGCGAALEDLVATVAFHGAMASSRERFAARRWKAKGIWMRKFFRKGSGGGDVLLKRRRSLLCQALKEARRARFPKCRP
jgi:hypothetical protein